MEKRFQKPVAIERTRLSSRSGGRRLRCSELQEEARQSHKGAGQTDLRLAGWIEQLGNSGECPAAGISLNARWFLTRRQST